MTRVKRGILKNKRKSKILKLAKGFRNARSTKYKQAKQAVIKAGLHAFAHRRKNKRNFRKQWQITISGALKRHEISYSKFIDKLNKGNFLINRKMLATLAKENPETFDRVVSEIANTKVTATAVTKKDVEKKVEKTETKSKKTSEKDDLKKIEGIGPKIEEVLNKNGITTFAQLAAAKDEDTQKMIEEVRGNHQAGTWNEQAALARDGKWDELKTLQDALDGGVEK